MKRIYIQVTNDWFAAHQGKQLGVNVINAVQADDGFYYVDQNTVNDFPKLFTGNEIIEWKGLSDFKETTGIDLR